MVWGPVCKILLGQQLLRTTSRISLRIEACGDTWVENQGVKDLNNLIRIVTGKKYIKSIEYVIYIVIQL